jgi:hypothetical protein
MGTIPDLTAVKAFLGSDHSWSDAEIESALAAQVGNQSKRCSIPTDEMDPTWMPDPLVEALLRRTQVALALKPLPLGFVEIAGGDVGIASRAGSPSTDPLVRDLERPYRKLVLG